MNILLIAEKKEIAEVCANAISKIENTSYESQNTHFIVNNNNKKHYITWTQGHALELCEPQDYDKSFEKWNIESLPFNPEKIKKRISGNKERMKFIQMKLNEKMDEVIHVGDIDEEGQLIVDEVLEYYNFDPRKASRISIEDTVLDKVILAYKNRLSNNDPKFRGMSDSAYCRSVADQLYGLNLTRLYSVAGHKRGYSGVLTLGRVQTPVLSLIFDREVQNKTHKKILTYRIDGAFSNDKNNINATLNIESLSDFESLELSENKKAFNSKELAEKIKNEIYSFTYYVENVEEKEFKKEAPLPFSLADLQAECNKKFKYGVDQVLKITQSLRDNYSAITYNRTDCRYLTDELYSESEAIINAIRNNVIEYQNIQCDLNLKSRAFNSQKVTAHHGMIPTSEKFDISKLSTEEKNVYMIIARNFIAQFLPLQTGVDTSLTISSNEKRMNNNILFSAKYKKIKCTGWTILFSGSDSDDDNEISNVIFKENEKLSQSLSVKEIESKPPALFTQGTLITAMKSIAKYAKSEKVRKALIDKDKGKEGENGGIGTPATRANIIEGLFDKKYIVEDKKGTLTTTDEGKALLHALPEKFKAPDLTAIWHLQQQEVVAGKKSVSNFLDGVMQKIIQDIERVKSENIPESIFAQKCPKCHNGYLRKIKSAKGEFKGCTNFPDCDHSEQISTEKKKVTKKPFKKFF